jgi:chemotaxis protein CheX
MEQREIIVAQVVTAARQVFETMLGTEIQASQDYIENNTQHASGGVVALIGFGGHWMGMGMITCAPQLACKIASSMLMSEFTGITEEVLDAIAEITNMIFGYVKTEIEGQLGGLCLSIPTVIFGRNFATRSISQQAWSVVPVRVGDDTLELRICLSPNCEPRTGGRMQPRPFTFHEGS